MRFTQCLRGRLWKWYTLMILRGTVHFPWKWKRIKAHQRERAASCRSLSNIQRFGSVDWEASSTLQKVIASQTRPWPTTWRAVSILKILFAPWNHWQQRGLWWQAVQSSNNPVKDIVHIEKGCADSMKQIIDPHKKSNGAACFSYCRNHASLQCKGENSCFLVGGCNGNLLF